MNKSKRILTVISFSLMSVMCLSCSTVSSQKLGREAQTLNDTVVTKSKTITYRTGEMAAQYFTEDLGMPIVKIFDVSATPAVWGSIKITGVGSNIAVIEVRASGYPGQTATSKVTFKAICKK